jgi:hypothetical protein
MLDPHPKPARLSKPYCLAVIAVVGGIVARSAKPMTSKILAPMTRYRGGTPFFDNAADIAEDTGADAMKGMVRRPAPSGDVPWTIW